MIAKVPTDRKGWRMGQLVDGKNHPGPGGGVRSSTERGGGAAGGGPGSGGPAAPLPIRAGETHNPDASPVMHDLQRVLCLSFLSHLVKG